MKIRFLAVAICLSAFFCVPLLAQSHTAVQLENKAYYILEQAELRGLCKSLPGARPYTHSVMISAIKEILDSENADKLNNTEREILEQYLRKFSKPETGMDWRRGAWYNELAIGKTDSVLSANVGASVDIEGSGGLYPSSKDYYFGTEIWVQAYVNGDLGKYVSYELSGEGGLMRAPTEYLGTYNTYYDGFDNRNNEDFLNREIDIYSGPRTDFPYAYKKRWDGSVFFFNNLADFKYWPDEIAGGYNLLADLTGSFWEDKLILRMARMSHDWGATPIGSSLAFNQSARPFLGVETEFYPVPWFGIASLTGILEYGNTEGIKNSSMFSQNAFSITMMQFRYKNYLFLDFIDAVVWPKRFEIGYMAPIINSFFYQNNIGDFDNMALTFNIKAQYPGLGNVWFSFFMDEMNLLSDMLELDRTMIALQAGTNIPLPFLAFSSLKLSYTRINPYCYTHNRNSNPWYGDLAMETGYSNNGVNLGYYLPPNSDEILLQFRTMPVKSLITLLQYQLIRHGADFGPHAVDGSNMYSELDPHNRHGANPILKRYFLMDGAYQWSHIIKLGAEWTIPKIPVALFLEAGTVISYFTDIEAGKANTGKPYAYKKVDTPDYRNTTGAILKFGFKIFP